MDKEVDVSIIIINFNTLQLTKNCIESVFNKTKNISFEIIVVDNASTDESKEILVKDNRINYIYSEKNLGFGQGNNLGAENANGKYLFFLNPDTILLNNAVYILANFLDCNSSAIACGGNLYDADGKPIHSFRRYLPGFKWELNLLSIGVLDWLLYGINSEFNHTGKVLKVGYVTGADLMVSKTDFLKIGGFSKDFFMYYEETDLCFKLQLGEKNIYSVPSAKIIHLEGKGFTPEKKKHRSSIIEKSYQIYCKKNIHFFPRIIYRSLHNLYRLFKNLYLKFIFWHNSKDVVN